MFQNFKHQIACMTLRIHQKHAISGDFFLVKGPGPLPTWGYLLLTPHLSPQPSLLSIRSCVSHNSSQV